MSFMEGTFSAQRFRAERRVFAEYDVEALDENGPAADFSPDQGGAEACWVGGDHELDGEFDCGKQLRGPYMQWAFRVTKFAPPAGRVKAVYKTELKAVMAENDAEVPTAEMKREARELAQARIEDEGRDGRYLKRAVVPVVWDGETGEVWYGAASHAHAERFSALFADTFGIVLTPVTAGEMAGYDLDPAFTDELPAWCPDGLDWVGNEFALWLLWESFHSAENGPCPMHSLKLCCPHGANGSDAFAHDMPIVLPEVKRALQAGKLPRSVGLEYAGDDASYTLTLDPERWVVSGVKVPELEGVRPGRERELARLDQCRQVFRSADDLYRRFLDIRLSDGWADVRDQILVWTGRAVAV